VRVCDFKNDNLLLQEAASPSSKHIFTAFDSSRFCFVVRWHSQCAGHRTWILNASKFDLSLPRFFQRQISWHQKLPFCYCKTTAIVCRCITCDFLKCVLLLANGHNLLSVFHAFFCEDFPMFLWEFSKSGCQSAIVSKIFSDAIIDASLFWHLEIFVCTDLQRSVCCVLLSSVYNFFCKFSVKIFYRLLWWLLVSWNFLTILFSFAYFLYVYCDFGIRFYIQHTF